MWGCPLPPLTPRGADPTVWGVWSGCKGGEGVSVGPLGTGEVGEDPGKAEASPSSQIRGKFLVTGHSLRGV